MAVDGSHFNILVTILGIFIPERRKKDIENTVERVFKKYGPALRKLGKE